MIEPTRFQNDIPPKYKVSDSPITFLHIFRKRVEEMANPQWKYIPIRTELTGITNVALGTIQLATGYCMHFSSKGNLRNHSIQHLKRGWAALNVGLEQVTPTCLVVGAVSIIAHQTWTWMNGPSTVS